MASKTTETAKVESTEFSYPVDELISAAREALGVSPDIAAAAFAVSKTKESTLSDAKRIVTAFAKKEVN